MKKENENRGSYDSPKWGKRPKETRKTHCVMVRFDDEEWLKFLSMYGQSGVYARAVFIKARVFSQPFRVLKVDKTLLDYYTKLSSFHAQYRAVGNNYNQVVKELRVHFSEKKAMALLYKLEKCTQELVLITQQIIRLTQTALHHQVRVSSDSTLCPHDTLHTRGRHRDLYLCRQPDARRAD